MKPPKRILTHSGSFHADDVFAVAVALLAFGEIPVKRTRNPMEFGKEDLVIDIGGVYDPEILRFDHHQQGGAGERPNGIPYASFGLMWKEFGLALCEGVSKAFEKIDYKLVSPIDAIDNGIELSRNLHKGIYPYTIHDVLSSFHGSFDSSEEDQDKTFTLCVEFATGLLRREIKHSLEYQTLQKNVEEAYKEAEDKRLVILDGKYPWSEILLSHPEPLFVVYPDGTSGRWSVKGVPLAEHSFERRKLFPLSWAGKRDTELEEASGVEGALFCHNGRFIAVAQTKEGAILLARKAIETS